MKLDVVTTILMAAVAGSAALANDPFAEAEFGERVKSVLAREVWFMAEVSALSPREKEMLADEAQKALARWGARIESHSLAASLRRELTPLLKSISRDGWEKFDAERERLEQRRYHATIMGQVAKYDEALLLTSDEREKLSAELAETARGIAWHTRENAPPLFPACRLPSEISAGGLGRFEPAEAQLAAVLTPDQLAAYQQLKGTIGQNIVVNRPGSQVAAGVHPPFDEHRRRLSIVLERFIDAADAACGLDSSQRQKLLLAGQIDIDRFAEQYRAIESRAAEDAAKREARLAALSNRARAILAGPDSSFQRTLRARLTGEQRAKLAIAERGRHDFRRQALVEAAVVGFERSAALTCAQCIELHQAFQEAIADSPEASPINCLRTIARLPREKLRPIFADQQWPAIERQLSELEEVARRLDEEMRNKVAVIHFVNILAVGKDGQVESQAEFDERLKID